MSRLFFALCNVFRNARLCRSAKTGKRVKIPRCRATVSEETALDHWEKSREGRWRYRMRIHPYSRSQETGALRLLQPLSRAKEDGMRVFVGLTLGLILSVAASAADLKVNVVDPQSAAVAGAQVSLLRASKVLATQSTSAEGTATLRTSGAGPYRIQVLAAGFAGETIDVSSQPELTVKLRLAPASETVVVSATRTPVPSQAAGADVDTLSAGQLITMQPTAASDAIRFLRSAEH